MPLSIPLSANMNDSQSIPRSNNPIYSEAMVMQSHRPDPPFGSWYQCPMCRLLNMYPLIWAHYVSDMCLNCHFHFGFHFSSAVILFLSPHCSDLQNPTHVTIFPPSQKSIFTGGIHTMPSLYSYFSLFVYSVNRPNMYFEACFMPLPF